MPYLISGAENCSSELSRMLFICPDDWEVFALISRTRSTAGPLFPHTEYQLLIRVIPRDVLGRDFKTFEMWTRYSAVKSLYDELKHLVMKLPINCEYPRFAEGVILGNRTESVIAERTVSITHFLNFVCKHPILRKSIALDRYFKNVRTVTTLDNIEPLVAQKALSATSNDSEKEQTAPQQMEKSGATENDVSPVTSFADGVVIVREEEAAGFAVPKAFKNEKKSTDAAEPVPSVEFKQLLEKQQKISSPLSSVTNTTVTMSADVDRSGAAAIAAASRPPSLPVNAKLPPEWLSTKSIESASGSACDGSNKERECKKAKLVTSSSDEQKAYRNFTEHGQNTNAIPKTSATLGNKASFCHRAPQHFVQTTTNSNWSIQDSGWNLDNSSYLFSNAIRNNNATSFSALFCESQQQQQQQPHSVPQAFRSLYFN